MRTRMVTRTIISTEMEVKMYHKSTNEVVTEMHTVAGKFDAESYDKAMKLLKKLYEYDDAVVVAIVSMTPQEHKYGMLETDFVQYAEIIDKE